MEDARRDLDVLIIVGILRTSSLLPELRKKMLEDLIAREATSQLIMVSRPQVDAARLFLAGEYLADGQNESKAKQLIQVQMERLLQNKNGELVKLCLETLTEFNIFPMTKKILLETMIELKNSEKERLELATFYTYPDEDFKKQ